MKIKFGILVVSFLSSVSSFATPLGAAISVQTLSSSQVPRIIDELSMLQSRRQSVKIGHSKVLEPIDEVEELNDEEDVQSSSESPVEAPQD